MFDLIAEYQKENKDFIKGISRFSKDEIEYAVDVADYGEKYPEKKSPALLNAITNLAKDTKEFAVLINGLQYHQTVEKWAKTKQVFVFEKDMITELARTDSEIKLAKDIFDYLPCDTMYLDFSSNAELCKKTGFNFDGVLVNLEKKSFKGKQIEDLFANHKETYDDIYRISFFLYGNGKTANTSSRINIPNTSDGVEQALSKSARLGKDIEDEKRADDVMIVQTLVVQSLIYFSSLEPDIKETTASKASRASFKKQKDKGKRDKPAQIFSVGERFGEAFRSWTKGQLNTEKSESTGRHNKPHFRRAHWHRYWVGKRDSKDRQLIVKWVHQCLCGDKTKGLDTVKHEVSRETE